MMMMMMMMVLVAATKITVGDFKFLLKPKS